MRQPLGEGGWYIEETLGSFIIFYGDIVGRYLTL